MYQNYQWTHGRYMKIYTTTAEQEIVKMKVCLQTCSEVIPQCFHAYELLKLRGCGIQTITDVSQVKKTVILQINGYIINHGLCCNN
jgi:hypothetical protein